MIWSHSQLHITVKYILILRFSFCACLCKIKANIRCAIRGFDNKLSTFSLSFFFIVFSPAPLFLSFLNTFGTFHCKNALQIYVINTHEKKHPDLYHRFIQSRCYSELKVSCTLTYIRQIYQKSKIGQFMINWTSLTVRHLVYNPV